MRSCVCVCIQYSERWAGSFSHLSLENMETWRVKNAKYNNAQLSISTYHVSSRTHHGSAALNDIIFYTYNKTVSAYYRAKNKHKNTGEDVCVRERENEKNNEKNVYTLFFICVA